MISAEGSCNTLSKSRLRFVHIEHHLLLYQSDTSAPIVSKSASPFPPPPKKKHTHTHTHTHAHITSHHITSHHITSHQWSPWIRMFPTFSWPFLGFAPKVVVPIPLFQQMSAMSGRFVPAETTTSCMSWCSPPKWIITSTWNHLGFKQTQWTEWHLFFTQTFSETYGEKNLETWNLLSLLAQVASPPDRSTRRHLSPATSSSFRNSWPRCLEMLPLTSLTLSLHWGFNCENLWNATGIHEMYIV